MKSVVRRGGRGFRCARSACVAAARCRLRHAAGVPLARRHQDVDEAPVVLDAGEVAAAAQDQRLFDRLLQMPVLRFHRAVLVSLAAVVAAGVHAVVADEGIVALGDVLALVSGQVAEGGREAVGAMFLRCSAEGPQRLLQVLGQRREALPAENHGDVLPAAVDHDEVVEQMRKRLARDRHLQLLGMGEVGPTFARTGPCGQVPASGGR